MSQIKISVDDATLEALHARAAVEERSLSATAARLLRGALSEERADSPSAQGVRRADRAGATTQSKVLGTAHGQPSSESALAPKMPTLLPPTRSEPWVRKPFTGPDPKTKPRPS